MDAPKLPGVGKVKPIYLIGGLGIVLGVVGYAWWKNGQASAGDTSGATDAMAADTAATGVGDYIPPYQQFNTTGGADLSQLPPLDNPAWSQRVQDLLTTIGFDPGFVSNTIGKYLGRQPLSSAESDLVRTAIAMVGPVPVGQFAIIPTTTPPTTTPPPAVSTKLTTPTGLRATRLPGNAYRLTWARVPGALTYTVKRELGPGTPATITIPGTTRVTPPLRRHYEYSYRVQAHAPGKNPSNWSAAVRFKVP